MANMKQLAMLLKEIEDLVSACTRCGVCQSVCPVFSQTGREADVARGKLALIDGLLEEMFKDADGTFKRLERCLLCGSCEVNCASGVKTFEIFLKTRTLIAGYQGLPRIKKTIFRHILARPGTFDFLTKMMAGFQGILFKPADKQLGTSCAKIASPLISNRHIRSLAPIPFHEMKSSVNISRKKHHKKVAFFTGCLIDKAFPNVALSAIDVLQYHGVKVYIPQIQGCCGIPAIASGDYEAFIKLVRYNVELFNKEDFDFLVTACATCTATIKKIWPMMVKDESGNLKKNVDYIALKTLDISQLLVNELGIKPPNLNKPNVNKPNVNKPNVNKIDPPATVVYHDPCHLKKTLGISKEPRTLIQSNPHYQLIEMADADKCCGMGGSFNLMFYDISSDIGNLKGENIFRSGAGTVITGCPACMIQLSDIISKSGQNVSVKHFIEIYAETVKQI